mgnify:CR=1 FL=1
MEGQGQHTEGLNKTTGEWTKYSPPDGQCNGKSCDCNCRVCNGMTSDCNCCVCGGMEELA